MTELSASDAAYSLRDKESRIYFNMLITIYKESTSISAIPAFTIFKLNNWRIATPGKNRTCGHPVSNPSGAGAFRTAVVPELKAQY